MFAATEILCICTSPDLMINIPVKTGLYDQFLIYDVVMSL